MKLLKTIKWLLNSPPVSITSGVPDGTVCDYCGLDYQIFLWGNFCYCSDCLKKVMDSVLKTKKKG